MNLAKNDSYIGKFDALDENQVKFQIKSVKKGSEICLGDIFRNSEINDDFVLVIGFWKDNKNNIVEEYKIQINGEKWIEQFDGFNEDSFKEVLKTSNKSEDDSKWKNSIQKLKRTWNNSFIKPRFKRDHKKQRRIQCAITNTDFHKVVLETFEWQKL
jgi:hypothetical protein